ncbi:MAG: SIMPL domain-containing protein [archaeon]
MNKKAMQNSVQITLIIVAGAILLSLIGYYAFASNSSSNTINVQGYSEIDATPDLATVYFNVQTKGDTSEEATQKNSEIVDDLITKLVVQGFERKDIQTQGFNVYPDYEWVNNQRREKGYVATHSLRLEMPASESSKIGKAIDVGVEAGAGINYINFELTQEKENELKAEAIALAAQDAKIKAESVAGGLGKKVGKLVSVSVNEWRYSPWIAYSGSGVAEDAALAKEASTTIQPSEQKVTATVSAVFRIK